jgi:hypothetical protein
MATPDNLNKELMKVTQTTGTVAGGSLDTSKGRASWQIRTRSDISNMIYQLNVVYYNIVKTLTDGRDAGRENVLEAGIAGTNIICYQDATVGSCYWADLLEKPATIKEVTDCILGKISSIQNQLDETVKAEEYDDSSLIARLDCIELNLLQVAKDALGEYNYGCDGASDFSYSLASIINAIGANFDGFTSIHIPHSDEDTAGPYTLSIYSSAIIWDAPVAQINVVNLMSDLECVGVAIAGQDAVTGVETGESLYSAGVCINTWSSYIPTSPVVGSNNIVSDGDSIRQAIKALDSATASVAWTTIATLADGGAVAGASALAADTSADGLTFKAGTGITITGQDSPEELKFEVTDYSLQDAYAYGTHGLLTIDNTYPTTEQGITIRDSSTPISRSLFMVQSDGGTTGYLRVGQHENYADDAAYETYRMDLVRSPLYMEPTAAFTPSTTGSDLSAPLNGTTRGAIWVSDGDAALTESDKHGNDLAENILYYREPMDGSNPGRIHNLTCCPLPSDGFTVVTPSGAGDPQPEVKWTEASGADTRISRAGDDDFFTIQEHTNNGGAKHFSIGVVDPSGNTTAAGDGANYYEVNLHDSALMFAKSSSATNIPETDAAEGALWVPHDSTTYSSVPVTAGRLYYRAPGNGAIYDLTTAGSGSAQNLFQSIDAQNDGGTLTGSGASDVAATAGFTFGDTEFDDVNSATITLVDSVGLSKTYVIRNDYGASTALEFNAGASASVAAANFKAVVESAGGHNGTITVTDGGSGAITMTQTGVKGAGNTAIGKSSWDTITDVNAPSAFSGGRTTSVAGSAADTFTFVAGSGVTIAAGSDNLTFELDTGSVAINAFSNVNTSPADGHLLYYDNAASEWKSKLYSVIDKSGGSGISLQAGLAATGEVQVKKLNVGSSKLTVAANGNGADVDIDIGTFNFSQLTDIAAIYGGITAGDLLVYTGSGFAFAQRRSAQNMGGGNGLIKQVSEANNRIEVKSILADTNTKAISVLSNADELGVSWKYVLKRVAGSGTHTIASATDLAAVDTSLVAAAITLPLADSVQPGTVVKIVDEAGNAHNNNITVASQGSNVIARKDTAGTASSFIMSQAHSSVSLYSNGASGASGKWIQLD